MKKQFLIAEIVERSLQDTHNGDGASVHAFDYWNGDEYDSIEDAEQAIADLLIDYRYQGNMFTVITVYVHSV